MDADDEDDTDSGTSVVGDVSSGDGTDVTGTNDAHTNDSHQNLECEPLDETWKCSSGSKNHSLCIKFCTIGLDLSRV